MMKKLALSGLFTILFFLVLSTCASVNSQGKNYFVGRSENDLIKHFGYNGVVKTSTGNNEYDKIVFFTNKIIKYRVSKVNTVLYKVLRQTEEIQLAFNEFSDGCLVLDSYTTYGQHIYSSGGRYLHNNDNSTIRPRINEFNNLLNRYTSYPSSQSNSAFDRHNIGDSYYLYQKNTKQEWSPGITNIKQAETYTSNRWYLWRIDVVAENRSETEAYIIGQYYERQNQYYSGNGNSIITVPQINSLIEEYRSKGFTYTTDIEGLSLLAYIKNGKVVRVEENK